MYQRNLRYIVDDDILHILSMYSDLFIAGFYRVHVISSIKIYKMRDPVFITAEVCYIQSNEKFELNFFF